jgi:hypothetical protein
MTDIKLKDNSEKENEIQKGNNWNDEKYVFLKGGQILVFEQLENSS